jgi:hypothetical protein
MTKIQNFFRRIIKLSLKNNVIKSFLKETISDLLLENQNILKTDVIEIRPLNCHKSNVEINRLNILIPGLSIQHVFGGIATALSFFETLGKDIKNLRIIITDEIDFKLENNRNYSGWKICNPQDDYEGFVISVLGDRENKSLSVGINDRFIATAWWTEFLAKHLQESQKEFFKFNEFEKFIYLIQDYEPGFYPWSSRYSLAESTYHDADRYIAVMNSSFLMSFFDAENYNFPERYVFEPFLHPKLKANLHLLKKSSKKKRILIYGRPSVDRNAFQIIFMSIRMWLNDNKDTDWEFFSIGEKHQDINLGSERKLISLGKLSLDDYARELSEASVGISLMVSPHPSYPPLEMAAFGIKVITNHFKGKNLTSLNSNILSIKTLNLSTLASLIDKVTKESSLNNTDLASSNINPHWKKYLESENNLEDICFEILPKIFKGNKIK